MMVLRAVLRICQVTGLVSFLDASPSEAFVSECSESELLAVEDDALAASTLLLQANIHQSRVATAGFQEARVPSKIYSLFSHLEGDEFDSVLANTTEIPEEASDLWPVLQLVNSGKDKAESDPMWASVHELIRRFLKNSNSEAEELVRLCQSGDMEQFSKKGCARPDGQRLINGVPADRYFCGVQNSGINWGSEKAINLCRAEVGSAYTLSGFCGSLSKKQLVLNFLNGVHKTKEDPRYINVPSVTCIMDLADCDIYFCQHCSHVGCVHSTNSSV